MDRNTKHRCSFKSYKHNIHQCSAHHCTFQGYSLFIMSADGESGRVQTRGVCIHLKSCGRNTHTHMHTDTRTRTRTHGHAQTHTGTHTLSYIHTSVHIQMHIIINMRISIYAIITVCRVCRCWSCGPLTVADH